VAKTGDTMAGHLTLPTGPAAANAVRKDYVDSGDATNASAAAAAQSTANTANTAAGAAQTTANNANTNANNRVAKTGDTMWGDLTLYRAAAPTTGVLYFGSAASQYIYYNGTQFQFTGPVAAASISVTGVAASNYVTTSYGGAAGFGGPANTGVYYDGWALQVRAGGSNSIGMMNAGGGGYYAVFQSGTSIVYTQWQVANNFFINGQGYISYGGDWVGWSIYNTAGYGMGMYYISNQLYFGPVNSAGAASGIHSWSISPNSVQLHGAGGAWKPGGGSWADSSDARIKNVEGNYASGLAEIVTLNPVLFTFKGNDTVGQQAPTNRIGPPSEDDEAEDLEAIAAPYANSPHYKVATEGVTYIGLIAQECEAAFPEMVSLHEGTIDGEPVTDLRGLDITPLHFAMINAFKEINSRLETLEGGTRRKKR